MGSTFKTKIKKLILFFLLGFVVLFIFRLIYGYTLKTENNFYQSQFFDGLSNIRKNYASKEYKMKSGSSSQSLVKVDQKYEKIANINTKSSEFEKEEKHLRSEIKSFDAIIQFEQNSGNNGNRKLHLLIGVQPEKFEALYIALLKIGKIQSKEITKKDKTNEYKQLNAKKESLMKIRASLIDLKSKGGKIEEYINLQNRILDIEDQLQNLGVQLGNYDEENEFCTIKYSIIESFEQKISFIHRVKVAIQWTVGIYLKMVIIVTLITFISYLLLLIIDKLKVFEKLVNRLKDE